MQRFTNFLLYLQFKNELIDNYLWKLLLLILILKKIKEFLLL